MWRITDWKKHFENNRTRELKHMGWVPLPNKHDGDGYTDLMDHPDGAAHFGSWVALVQVASRCDPRGTLLRDSGAPHCGASLSRMTRIPEPILEVSIARLIGIGWMEEITEKQGVRLAPHEGAVSPQASAMNGTEGNGTEGNTLAAGAASEQPAKVKRPRSPKQQENDALFDAVASAFGLTPASATDAPLIGKVAASLRAKGAKPEDIPARMKNYAEQMPPGTTCTPTALDKHWALCAKGKPNGNAPPRSVARIEAAPGKYDRVDARARALGRGLPYQADPTGDPPSVVADPTASGGGDGSGLPR